MIILHGQRFRVASYHKKINPEHADAKLSQGLVLGVHLVFEDWLAGLSLQAEAFLDPGADHTLISQRWIAEQATRNASTEPTPWISPNGRILERIHISTGYEDLLLGRDFLSQHGLLVVIDGEGRDFSIVAPEDSENRRRRDQIISLLKP